MHQIGAGALGPVFRAYQPEKDRLVAVKLFRLDLPPERVHTLVAALSSLVAEELTHPAIATPIAAGMSGVNAYLAQDFVAAESLDVVIRTGGSSSPEDVVRVATAVAGALDFAAARGVLHGALHPRDVMVAGDDVRITGLGVARALDLVGVQTPVRRPYSAPERAVGGPWDGRADMFSFASLMFELLFGKRVSGAGERAVASLPDVDGVDKASLKRLFAKALAGDPGGRFSSGAAFADALATALTPRSQQAPLPILSMAVEEDGPAAPLDAGAEEATIVSRAPIDPVEPLVEELELPDLSDTVHEPTLAPPLGDFAIEHVRHEAGEPTLPASHMHDLTIRRSPDHDDHEFESDRTIALPPEPAVDVPSSGSAAAYALAAKEAARSSVWPIGLALVVGIGIGFGLAMVVLGRNDAASVATIAGQTERPAATQVVDDPLVPITDASRPPSPEAGTPPPAAATPAAPPRTDSTPPTPSEPAAPAPRPAAAPVTGRVAVRTTPSGARVSIDGRNAGVTPLTIPDVAPGVHALRITRDGYVTDERRVTVTAARPSPSVNVRLERTRPPARTPAPDTAPRRAAAPAPAATSGSLVVESRPAGASVYVDGRLAGRTPLLLDEVSAAEHAIRLELAGHRQWASSVRVVAGERARVAASLEQQQ